MVRQPLAESRSKNVTNISSRGRRDGFRFVAVFACLVVAAVSFVACSDDSSGDSESSETPEDVKAPMSEVVAELPTMVAGGDAAKAAAADGDFDKAARSSKSPHEVWEEVEGTIKSTDPDIYERIETAQGLIKDGAETKKADRVATGAADQAAAVQDFIAANQ